MKQIFTLLTGIVLSGSLLAQQSTLKQAPAGMHAGPATPTDRQVQAVRNHANQLKSMNTMQSRWYNYGDAVDAHASGVYPGTISSLSGNYLFPDSTIKAQFGTVYAGVWIHAIGDVFDPTSAFFNDATYFAGQMSVNKTNGYSIDTVTVYTLYQRKIANPAIVDSLILEIGSSTNFAGSYYFLAPSPVCTNLGTDTCFFKALGFDHITMSMYSMTNHMRYAQPLTALSPADTIPGGFHLVNFPTATFAAVPAGQYVGVGVRFKPGYTWTANSDTLNKKNMVNFFSWQEMGQNAFPAYYTKHDWNSSSIVPNEVLYSQSPGNWDSLFIPNFAYEGGTSATYGYDHHLIYYHATCTTCGTLSTNDLSAGNLSIGNAFPNPTVQGNDITLPISVIEKSKAHIAIYDLIGQQVGVAQDEYLNSGKTDVKLNTRNLQAGVYSVSVTVGSAVKTVRLIVTH